MLAIPIVLLVLGMGICRWAIQRYEGMWAKASKERAPTAHTGAEVAQLLLNFEGASEVQIQRHSAVVTNYFDPARKRLFLSPEVADSTHMAAWTVALHLTGHAVQEGEAVKDYQWRLNVIKLNRYLPTLGLLLVIGSLVLLRIPARMGLLAMLALMVVLLLLNLGSLSTEFRANAATRRFLEKHLAKWPSAQEALQSYLQRVATLELGDLLKSPRYFFFSAMPGTSSSPPKPPQEPKNLDSSFH